MAAGGFALTATHFFYKRLKKVSKKTLAPAFGPRRLGFLRCGIDPGAAATVCFAAPPSAVSGCARRSLRSHARINPSAQPSDVAGGSRSKALELALIVEWGGCAAGSCAALFFCGLSLLAIAISKIRMNNGPTLISVGAGLPAMAAFLPTSLCRIHHYQLWERACSRWLSQRYE